MARCFRSASRCARLYAADEYEFYMQDSWRLRDNLTVTAGLRYSLYSPPYERNGVQVSPSVNLGEWFDAARGEHGARHSVERERAHHVRSGRPGERRARLLRVGQEQLRAARRGGLVADAEDWCVRGGYSIVYDRVGAGIASSFDAGGSFGLSTSLNSPVNQFNENNPAMRFQGINVIPPSLRPAPPGGYPATPPLGAGVITTSIDSSIVTPYSHIFNLVVSFDLGRATASKRPTSDAADATCWCGAIWPCRRTSSIRSRGWTTSRRWDC